MEGSGLPLTDGSDGADVWVGPLPVSTVPFLTRGGREAVPGSRTGSGRLHKGLPERLPPGLFFAVAGFEAGRHSSTVPRLPPSGARGSASLNRQSWWSGDRGKAPNCFHNPPFLPRGCTASDGRVGESGWQKADQGPCRQVRPFAEILGWPPGGGSASLSGRCGEDGRKRRKGDGMIKTRKDGKRRSKKKSLFGQKVLARGWECGILLLSQGGRPPPTSRFSARRTPQAAVFCAFVQRSLSPRERRRWGRNQTERELRTCATRF